MFFNVLLVLGSPRLKVSFLCCLLPVYIFFQLLPICLLILVQFIVSLMSVACSIVLQSRYKLSSY